MANPQNVEMEAAKFLHRLIQESKDEPTKLATKLYVILQHMRSSGKENSMPYQVISRAMETVIKDHNLDVESLMSSRLPLTAGAQMGDSASSQLAGPSQRAGAAKDSNPSFSGNEMGTPETYASTRVHTGPASGGPDIYQGSPASGSYLSAEPANRMQFGNSSFDGQGFATKTSKDRSMEVFSSVPSGDHSAGKGIAGKTLDHGGSSMANNANKGSSSSSLSEPNVLRASVSMDTGKSPICQSSSPGRPFNDQQLKQLRAQCLVFLAFRNGLMPKKLHLEIALGNIYTKEDGSRRDLVDQKGKEQLVNDQSSVPQIPRSLERPDSNKGCPSILNSYSSKEVDFAKLSEARSSRHAMPAENEQDRKNSIARGKTNAEELTHEAKELHAYAQLESHDSSTREILNHKHDDDSGNTHQPSTVMAPREQSKLEESGGSGNGFPNDIHKAPLQTNFVMNDALLHTKDDAKSRTQNPVDGNSLGKIDSDKKLPSNPLKDHWKPVAGMSGQNYDAVPIMDSNMMVKNVSQGVDQEEDYTSISTEIQPSPKHTTIDGWILERQKRKVLTERNWAHKQQKTEQRIAASSDKLKEIVSSSEDISAKTKSVIELKKLQLLELQRRLRSDILNDFFKPIASEMDKLKSIKKHRIGRRSKQIERYEQRMKEERLKRIRERQKEFFSELEVHRERLEDGFKIKKERWKGLNRYVREFHKRKERFHREKTDRIQREKINLLKINDVEGYLRMVQDAKSDRVDKLLKETEKYLQKLGSKLKDAKAMARQFESGMEETKGFVEENEDSIENEDEKDQAKHYLESNEKYYLMAHSVKENIIDQPASLIGGKLREYQMNGLRWLVSLYNNHLNGILADEMGLGKTVQVISLICYLMETKNDRGPFLIVVPSSVLPGWESEMKFWAPSIHRIIYSGPPEERRRLFKEHIVHQKFNVLLTTYEYLMNKHDRPKLSKIQWHYVIIDEGHRIKNASCKLNADLKHYRSNHRLLLTGTPLQNNLEELWALLNFLLPNIFNSSDDFSQWFNKPFESNGDNSPDEAALLSEEENLLIINRLHQVLRPFVLRRLKHKVENELPEKIERLVRCEASSYQKLLMKRVEDNLGAIGTSKARTVHNSVMELRNICNHPYLSQLHVEEVHDLIPKHYLPNVVRLCGKLEMLDRLLPKLKATDHRVLLFSTMTRLLDVMEDYLCWKQYRYLRLDGHTSGGDRGGLIERFNNPDSPYFIFLLSIRAGGVGVNLQAADTVIIFDTDWNPQVDLQAQARAHRIGQKKDVLVIRLETVQTVEEQVRASAEHKLGVANQSITAGFFDNNTSAEDRREYLESLLRENKKEEDAPVLDDDSLNDIIARSESEIDVFESIDKQRRDEEMVAWQNIFDEEGSEKPMQIPPLPSRLLNDGDLKSFYEVMKISDTPTLVLPNAGMKRKSGYLGGLDTQQYGRGKRAREVRSYEEQMTEEEFERLCAVETPDSPKVKEEVTGKTSTSASTVSTNSPVVVVSGIYAPAVQPQQPQHPTMEPTTIPKKDASATATETEMTTTATTTATPTPTPTPTPPSKRGRGRPKRVVVEAPPPVPCPPPPGFEKPEVVPKVETKPVVGPSPDSLPKTTYVRSITGSMQELGIPVTTNSGPTIPPSVTPQTGRGRGRGRKSQTGGETPVSRRRGKVQAVTLQPVPVSVSSVTDKPPIGEIATSSLLATSGGAVSVNTNVKEVSHESNSASHASVVPSCEASVVPSASVASVLPSPSLASVLPSPSPASVLPSALPASVLPSASPASVLPSASPASVLPSASPASVVQSASPASVVLSASPASVVSSASPASVVSSSSPASVVLSASPASVVLSSSPASVVPSVSGPSVVDVRSQVGADSGSAVASGHALSGPVTAASVNQPDPGIVPASNPQANIALLAGVPSAQSSIPCLPVAVQGKGRGRGRGRGRVRGLNAQSQEDTPPPQRRRRRQEPVVSSIPGAVIGQDSASSEPPRKRTRASGGRKGSVIGERNHDLTNASQYAVAQDFKGPSADQVPKGTDTGEEKFADPRQEQTTNEKEGKDHSNKVLSLNSNSNGLSPVLTLDPPAKVLSALSKPVNQSAREIGESNDQKGHDNQDSCEDSSLISIPVVFGIDDNHGTSEDPQTLLVSNSTVEAATTSGSMPLAGMNDKSDPLCHNKDDTTDFSEESTNMDELPASDNLLKGAADRVFSYSTPGLCNSKNTLVALADSQSLPVLSNNSVGAAEDQVLHGAKVQDASALVSMPSPGESSKSEPPRVKGGNKITESSKIPNLDESLAMVENTSEMMKNTYTESEIVQKDDQENKTATVEAPVSMTDMASVDQPDPASVIASTSEAVAQDIVDPSVNQVPKEPVVETNSGVDLHQHEGKGPISEAPASKSDSGNQSLGGLGESNDNKGPCVDTSFASTKTHGSSEVCQSLLAGESDDDSHEKEDDGNKGPENLSDKIVSENETQKQSSSPSPLDVAAPENLSGGMNMIPEDSSDKNALDVEVSVSTNEEVSNPSNLSDGAAVKIETEKLVADGHAGENATNCEEVLPETTGNQD